MEATIISIENVQAEINHYLDVIEEKRASMKPTTKESGKIKVLQQVILYLETNPSLHYLKRERERLASILDRFAENYSWWYVNNAPKDIPETKWKARYASEMGIAGYRKQLQIINYILSNKKVKNGRASKAANISQ